MSAFDLYRAAAGAAGGYYVAFTYNSHRTAYRYLPVVKSFPTTRWMGMRMVIGENSCHLVISVNWQEGGEAFMMEYIRSGTDPTGPGWEFSTIYMDQLRSAGFKVNDDSRMGNPDVKTYQ